MEKDILNIYYKSVEYKINKRYPSLRYEVEQLELPPSLLQYDSYWRGLESIIHDLITRFDIPVEHCLEFGTEYGYSAVAFSNYFRKVTGVDTFDGDDHTGKHANNYEEMVQRLARWKNIKLVKSDYRDFIENNHQHYDLIHVDIIHTFSETYNCGLWAAEHSKCAIFHDTESYPEVKKACYQIACATNKLFYNYDKFFGLGIIV
ncbi:hypothetical protein HDC92_004944 [Pedobacter sp. AK017]|uniref:class I SAM-dependent methyltransferase n=1 Tax=Pedobacter sp. AK017 TaxID=2723073 RepID=UPI001608FFD3|nr:class I SAM-dependent methyltransferase [Pedobacter sp. AK017]MBB5441237.1 hypothetical protein [Pedobacter sp. AK017]